MMEESKFSVGLIQVSCSDNPDENLRRLTDTIQTAATRGARIICLEELFRSRYFCQQEKQDFFKLAEPVPGPTVEALSPLARRHSVVIVASIFEREGKDFFNTAVVIDTNGDLIGKYRKIHIPDDLKNYYGEAYYFKKGNLGYPVFKTEFATIGLQICYDQWFPEGSRALARAGAEIIFYPTAIGFSHPLPLEGEGGRRPGEGAEHDAWITIQRGHAIANGVFVAACNRVGREDHIDFWGSSFVCDPMGKILGKASSKKEEVLVVECDLSRIEQVRKDWPFLKEC